MKTTGDSCILAPLQSDPTVDSLGDAFLTGQRADRTKHARVLPPPPCLLCRLTAASASSTLARKPC